MAARYSLQFAEALAKFQPKEQVTLAFPYPPGSPSQAPVVTKVSMGEYLQGTEGQTAERRSVERGVLLETCRAVGAPNDTAKTLDLFKTQPVQTPRDTFSLAMANALYEQAQLYGRRKMDQPDRLKIFSERALQLLEKLPDSKQKKELTGKLKAALKDTKAA
jgi:hypothetical protein